MLRERRVRLVREDNNQGRFYSGDHFDVGNGAFEVFALIVLSAIDLLLFFGEHIFFFSHCAQAFYVKRSKHIFGEHSGNGVCSWAFFTSAAQHGVFPF